MKKKTLPKFLHEASLVHGAKYDYSKVVYTNTKTKICIICPVHGEFWQTPEKHINRKQGCSKCSKKHKWTTKEFIENCKVKYNDLYDYSKCKYVDAKTKVTIICNIHGEFKIIPYDFLNNKCGCPHCGINRLTSKKFIILAQQIHGDLYDYSKSNIINWSTKSEIICKEHGSFFQTPVNHIYNRQKCPVCKIKNQTILFERLTQDFLDQEIEWEASPDWLDRQRFDIYFPFLNIAIEYDGMQHFKSIEFFGGDKAFLYQQQMDKLKEDKCVQNNCKLFRVKYNYNEVDYMNLIKQITNLIKSGKRK